MKPTAFARGMGIGLMTLLVGVLGAPSSGLADLDSGLVAYWSFDEGSSDTAYDYSGNGNDGTIYGAAWVDGISDSALYFDGQDDYVFVPDSNSLDLTTDGTVMEWIQIPSSFSPPYGGVGFVNKMLHSTGMYSYELGIDHDGPCFGAIGDGVNGIAVYCNDYHRYETPDFLYDDTWHLLAFTWNPTELILYIDGAFENSHTNTTSGAQISTWDLHIGRRKYQPTGWEYYEGLIDEVRIYNRALSEAEIESLYYEYVPRLLLPTSPTQNELNVAVNTNISVTFDKDMDESTVNDSTFVVNARSTGLHQGTITYDSLTRTATLDPTDDFDVGEVVTVVLSRDIQSSQGVPLDNSYIWSFTTVVNDGPGTFDSVSVYLVCDGPQFVFAADLNGDGNLDLTTANATSDSVSVLLNNGDGTFASHSVYSVGINTGP